MVYKFFDKNSSAVNTSNGVIKKKIMINQQLAEELHNPIIRKVGKRKGSICGADVADM